MSKVISRLLWFCFTRLYDWSTKFVPFTQPMGSQTETNRAWSHAFSRAWRRLHVFASSSDWLIVLFTSVLIGQRKYFGFGLKTAQYWIYFKLFFPDVASLFHVSDKNSHWKRKSLKLLSNAKWIFFSKTLFVFGHLETELFVNDDFIVFEKFRVLIGYVWMGGKTQKAFCVSWRKMNTYVVGALTTVN